jgi:hypothetical protein
VNIATQLFKTVFSKVSVLFLSPCVYLFDASAAPGKGTVNYMRPALARMCAWSTSPENKQKHATATMRNHWKSVKDSNPALTLRRRRDLGKQNNVDVKTGTLPVRSATTTAPLDMVTLYTKQEAQYYWVTPDFPTDIALALIPGIGISIFGYKPDLAERLLDYGIEGKNAP